MPLTSRAAALTNFEKIALECGLDAHALVAQVRLPANCLTDPDISISSKQAAALLELAAMRAAEPAFGLRMAASRRLSNLGPLGMLLRDEPTLRRALETLIARVHLHSPSFSLSLVEEGGLVNLREETEIEGSPPVRQAVEMAMGTTFRILRLFLGERWQPRMVSFRHAAPPNITWHRNVFGHGVQFGADFNEIVCNARDLEAPNPGADPVMARYSQRLLEASGESEPSMSHRVRKLVVLLLPRGHCRAELVAEQLGITRRSVYNHLAAEKTSFKQLVDAMRSELLRRYTDENKRSLSDIAAMLGFSELSSFSRWHQRQYGVSASQNVRGD